MRDWKTFLKADATAWLLEEINPSVRYFTLRWLLDKPETDPDVAAASRAIAQSDPIQKILNRQRPEGYWGSDSRPHHGTKGYLTLLMWLGYQGNGEVKKALDYRIEGCLGEDGSYGIELKERIVKLPCHGSDLLRQMLWYGYQEDSRTKRLLHWLIDIQEEDGVWPCISKVRSFSCLWATADVLRAYQMLPEDWITPEIQESQNKAVLILLKSKLHRYGKEKPSPRWFEFGFPLQFDSDILEVMGLVASFVSPTDERIQEGLNFILEKQDSSGRWPCEKHPKGGKWMGKFVELEEIGKPSKWVTLHAYQMLKTLYKE